MFSKGRKKGITRFAFQPCGQVSVGKVHLVGNFNQWNPHTMRRQKNGSYVMNVELSPGTHEYKFIVDEQWVVDPDNNAWSLNSYGTLNSIAQVE